MEETLFSVFQDFWILFVPEGFASVLTCLTLCTAVFFGYILMLRPFFRLAFKNGKFIIFDWLVVAILLMFCFTQFFPRAFEPDTIQVVSATQTESEVVVSE